MLGIKQQVSKERHISWDELCGIRDKITDTIRSQDTRVSCIISLGRGGLVPATLLAHKMDVSRVYNVGIKSYTGKIQGDFAVYQELHDNELWAIKSSRGCVLVVDDISDTGKTFQYVKREMLNDIKELRCVSFFIKDKTGFTPRYYGEKTSEWIVFPWETQH